MAFNAAPNHWLPSWSEDGTTIEVPIASFPELTAGEADGATGDIRKVAFAIADKLYTKFVAEGAASQPAKMNITKGSALDPATNNITVTYSFTFILAPTSLDVAAES